MLIYKALPRKEYERIFMCNTAKEIWITLLITHQGNSQVKDNKIDLLVQQYEQFVISEDESIDSAFARFNTIITSHKALDEGYSSKNYVRKFLRALHSKWRAKVMAIEESKDLTSLSLDELIENLKVHKMIIKKDSEIVKAKIERKSIALKAKMNLVMKSVRLSIVKTKSTPWRCGNPNHLTRECPKPPKDQRAFIGGSWNDSGEEDDEKVKDETCLVAHASSEEIRTFSMPNKDMEAIFDVVHHTLKKVVPSMVDKITNDIVKKNLPKVVAEAIRLERKKDKDDIFAIIVNVVKKKQASYGQEYMEEIMVKRADGKEDVKHGYSDPNLSKEDAEYMMFYEEYIQECLKHRDQVRR
uniref:UBN2 domain-containing protein n=1 Tax=Tanacetum cinerariifolium TaxID=118510 RepID=A0A6L2N9V9_TANCI|nr:UBN2 domain-containing protein [Tanacetum cinerariifolium]